MPQQKRFGKVTGLSSSLKHIKKMAIFFDQKYHLAQLNLTKNLYYQSSFAFRQIQTFDCIFQNNIIFQQMILKKHQIRKEQKIIEEQSLGDCSCQMLDTSLQDVGESDCSCSQCLEAHLQAFNELKELQQQIQKQNSSQNFRGFSTKRNENVKTRQGTRIRQQQNDKTKKRLMNYKSLGKIDRKHAKTAMESKNNEKNDHQMLDSQYIPPNFSSQCINEYVLIARHRAREYLQERKKLQINQIEERLKLKQLIKQNLMALKYTTQAIRQQEKMEGKPKHAYRWNHTPYTCRSRLTCRKINIYNPDLENKTEQIEQIKARMKKYKQENKQKPYECPDKCPRHHLRTSKAKLDEIEKYIKEKAKAMQAKHERQKKQKIKQQKIKQAKLRAIDLKCKQILERTKKYDPNISRTSFHNSVDHFSTFSQLKQFKQQKDAQKQKKRKFRIQENQRGGRLQEQIYQNLQEELIGDHPPIQSKIKKQNKAQDQGQQEEQWCEKIVYDAKIKPPKEIKKEDVQSKNKKNLKKEKQAQNRPVIKQKRQSEATLKKEEQRRKELQKEIERKKQQIYKEFKKRNSSFANKQDEAKQYRRKP